VLFSLRFHSLPLSVRALANDGHHTSYTLSHALPEGTQMLAYVHKYAHTYVRTYIHTTVRTYVHTYIRAYMHTYIHTRLRTPCPRLRHRLLTLSPARPRTVGRPHRFHLRVRVTRGAGRRPPRPCRPPPRGQGQTAREQCERPHSLIEQAS